MLSLTAEHASWWQETLESPGMPPGRSIAEMLAPAGPVNGRQPITVTPLMRAVVDSGGVMPAMSEDNLMTAAALVAAGEDASPKTAGHAQGGEGCGAIDTSSMSAIATDTFSLEGSDRRAPQPTHNLAGKAAASKPLGNWSNGGWHPVLRGAGRFGSVGFSGEWIWGGWLRRVGGRGTQWYHAELNAILPAHAAPAGVAGLYRVQELDVHFDAVCAVWWDGDLLLSGSWDTSVKLCNLDAPPERQVPPLSDSPQPSYISTTDPNPQIAPNLPRYPTYPTYPRHPPQVVRSWGGHAGRVRSVSLLREASLAVSGGADCSLRFWSLSSGAAGRIYVYSPLHALDVRDGCVVTGLQDATLKLWNASSGREQQVALAPNPPPQCKIAASALASHAHSSGRFVRVGSPPR